MRGLGLAFLIPLLFGLVFGDVPPVGGEAPPQSAPTTLGAGSSTDCVARSRRVRIVSPPRAEQTAPVPPRRPDAASTGDFATQPPRDLPIWLFDPTRRVSTIAPVSPGLSDAAKTKRLVGLIDLVGPARGDAWLSDRTALSPTASRSRSPRGLPRPPPS
jgi:hypothetical protein